jgi:hypothetical protein
VRYLLNLPLAVGAIAQLMFASLALMSGPWANWEDGPSRGAMAFIMFEPAAVSWLMLLVAGMAAVFTDAFEWQPIVHRGRYRLAAAGMSLIVVVTLGVCMAVALGESPAVATHDNDDFNPALVAIARIGGILGPLIAIAWLTWLIDAPLARRHLAMLRRPVLAMLGVTTVVGGIIGVQMLGEEIATDRATAARDRQMIDEREAENLAELVQINDATPLVEWLRLTDPLQTQDIRHAAMRRLAKRPTLEADLARSLQSADPDEADAALHLLVLVDLMPSAALDAPLRANFGALGRRIDTSRHTAGAGLADESYLDRWFGKQLAETLIATRKLAEGAGIDLRGADRQLASVVVASYPTSDSAKSYPKGISALDREIETALATRKPR